MEARVDRDATLLVPFDVKFFQTQIVGVRPAADTNQQDVTIHLHQTGDRVRCRTIITFERIDYLFFLRGIFGILDGDEDLATRLLGTHYFGAQFESQALLG